MKLNEYFADLRKEKLALEQKNEIYKKFLLKTEKIPFYKRTIFYVKTFVYCFFFIALYLSFWTSIKNVQAPNTNFSQIMTGYFVGQTQEDDNANYAKASPLGKIIEVKGDIKINDSMSLGSEFINKGDVVLIGQGSNLKFQVDSGATATISGPAKFSIETGLKDGNEIYVINLIYGDYFEIKSLDKFGTGVVIKTDKFEISQKDNKKQMDIKIYSKGKKQIIQNNGGELILTKKVKDKDVSTSIKTNQKVEISQDEKMLAEVKNIETEIKEQKLQSSYELSGENNENQNIEAFSGNIKTVLGEDDISKLKEFLDANSLNLALRNLLIAYVQGNDEFLDTSYKTYLQRFSRIYEIIKINFSDDVLKIYQKNSLTIDDVKFVCNNLKDSIDEKIYISPKYEEIIKQICNQFEKISEKKKGVLEQESLDFDEIITKLGLEKEDFIIK